MEVSNDREVWIIGYKMTPFWQEKKKSFYLMDQDTKLTPKTMSFYQNDVVLAKVG